ncbi:hypothetical protein A0H81_02993 [Grifola frondosa]|uniref:Uncharacterized protein n=1 Tax=Grifola frondosa TaxID=5627 RepID=A0A1C7MHX0_GRIFR|nr:hypothetical protein A0H81_02993 [Grifola frondosa]
MTGERDTLRSKVLEEHIFVNGINILRHYEGMRWLTEEINRMGKIGDANTAVWEKYVTFTMAVVFAHYVDIIPDEGGSAEVQAIITTGQVDKESGMQDGGHNC